MLHGSFNDSLEAYGKALAINPEQREALEYLGEACLELGRLTDAMAMLDRRKGVVLVFTDGYFCNGCGEGRGASRGREAARAMVRLRVPSSLCDWKVSLRRLAAPPV